MGDAEHPEGDDSGQLHHFTRALLADMHALERMLDGDLFETGVRRVGAEQEMFLVDDSMQAAPVAGEVIGRLKDPRLVHELALFNLEANVSARVFGGGCLSDMHAELLDVISLCRGAAAESGADVLLGGILPTIRKEDLTLDAMAPNPRYQDLNRTLKRLRGGGDFLVEIKGVDELSTTHDNVMLEACNTSFQIHFQVAPREFAKFYNVAQAVTAPVLSAAVNSPLFLGHRLWLETRVALFQRAVDERSEAHQQRGIRPRVTFGDDWVSDSVLEIYREQIARFRILLHDARDEDPMQVLDAGGVPKLSALRLHNGTIYRWNRACYGMTGGVPHLRIENRVLPAGPTVLDEVANAAFFFGLMAGVIGEVGDVTREMAFDDTKNNFLAAARRGLQAQFTWFGGETHTASDLILQHLLPMAREGLRASGVDEADVRRYLDVVEARVTSRRTGASWALESLAAMGDEHTQDVRERALTAAMMAHQRLDEPVHSWPLCKLRGDEDWRESYRTVGRIMSTDLFTVRADDLVDLAANLMDWERIRHIPVEDDQGRLLGVVTHRTLLRTLARRSADADPPLVVRDVMKADPHTVGPDTSTLEAMRLMKDKKVGCLPVVEGERLVGMVTEADLIEMSSRLLERYLDEGEG